MPITPLPTPVPTRLMSEEDFAASADALVAQLPTFVTEANLLQTDVNSKQVTATNAANTATTQATNASASATLASQWATTTGTQVAATDYSAKEYAIGTAVPAGSAKEWATSTGTAVDGTEYAAKEYASGVDVPTGSAKEWASTTGAAVAGGEYSSKEWAGGTVAASSKKWATSTGTTVDGAEYSAKEYAVGVTSPTGSAKDWANKTSGAVAGGEYSAKKYALDSLAYKNSAEAIAAAFQDDVGLPSLTGNAGKALTVNSTATGVEWAAGLPSLTGQRLKFLQVNSNGNGTQWVDVNRLHVSNRTSNVQLAEGDIGKFINITDGNFTQTFAPAATLGAGWWCYIRNAGGLTSVPLNGTFDTDTGWVKGAGWSITGGVASASNASSTLTITPPPLTPYTTYTIQFSVTVTSGSVKVRQSVNIGISPPISTSGTYRYTFTSTAATDFEFIGSSFSGSIDNIVVSTFKDVNITLDPSGSETIDGLTSYVMYPNEVRLIQCDGASLRTVVLKSFYKVFNTSGVFVKPPGYSQFGVDMWGGGGSGGAINRNAYAGATGGAGGQYKRFLLSEDTVGLSETVTVGSGGAYVTSYSPMSGVNGNNGGSTSFGSSFNVLGGGGGLASSVTDPLQGGSVGTLGAAVYILGELGSTGYKSGNTNTVPPQTVFSGGGGGSASGPVSSHYYCVGGTSNTIGGIGGSANTGLTVDDATGGLAPGGGGGGCTRVNLQSTSGAGARGELRIWGVV